MRRHLITGYRRGATQLRFLDVLTAVILTGILLYVASLQFATYHHEAHAPGAVTGAAKTP
jgi:hypothetical protein